MKTKGRLLLLAVALGLALAVPAPPAESQLYGECNDIFCSGRPFNTPCKCTLDSPHSGRISTCYNWPQDCWNGWPP
ncbi:MAG TPA: hypothetical protein VF756_13390 [Thermoanaerobaculia bacterium]